MNTPLPIQPSSLSSLGKLSDLLNLLAKLSQLNQPLNTPDGLRSAIEVLLQLGDVLGLDANTIAWLRGVLDNPAVFNIVLALVSYVLSVVESERSAAATSRPTHKLDAAANVQAMSLGNWITLILGIVQLLQKVLVV